MDFTEGKASIKFPAIIYKQEGTGDNKVNDIGDHYYLVTEDGDDAAKRHHGLCHQSDRGG
ncbi:MAG: hypothetical protein ACLTSX_13850 [Collinsella sp.]